MNIMSKTEIRKFLRQLNKQFGIEVDLNYIFIKSKQNKIFIINKDFEKIKPEAFNINTAGLYIAKQEIDGLRLTIEGSQIIGSKATKNILTLDNPEEWLKGKNIEIKTKLKGYVIVKYKDDFLGCGRVVKNRLRNYIPKTRRISELAPSS